MRFLTAAAVYLVALSLLLLGVAQRTIWAPASSEKYSITLADQGNFAVIDHATLTKFEGRPQITVKGGTELNQISVGRESDIVGWVGTDHHSRISFNTSGEKLVAENKTGTTQPGNPAGNDMWFAEASKAETAKLTIDPADDRAVLISAADGKPAPDLITLVWVTKTDLLPSNTLLISGLIVLLIGVILNFWAYYTMRKNRGPRRKTPRAPQGPKYRPKRTRASAPIRGRRSVRNFTAITSGVVVLATLSGCSSISEPSQSASPTASLGQNAPAVLVESQIQKIIKDVAKISKESDDGKRLGSLPNRFVGPALDARNAHYALQSKSKSIKPMTAISDEVIQFSLPAASNTWPRTAMVVTTSKAASGLPQMLVLQQVTPRENYKVWYAIDVLPGVKFPSVAATALGALEVAPDSLFLQLQPNQIPIAYGSLIDKGALSEQATLFNSAQDPFYQQVSKSQADTIAKLRKASVAVSHQLANANVISLSTSDSGALVALYMTDTYTIRPKRGTAVTVEGQEKLLYGGRGSLKGIRTVYGDMLLFYVPSSGAGGQIQTLGATQVLISVRGL